MKLTVKTHGNENEKQIIKIEDKESAMVAKNLATCEKYIRNTLSDIDFGNGYLTFKIDGEKVSSKELKEMMEKEIEKYSDSSDKKKKKKKHKKDKKKNKDKKDKKKKKKSKHEHEDKHRPNIYIENGLVHMHKKELN